MGVRVATPRPVGRLGGYQMGSNLHKGLRHRPGSARSVGYAPAMPRLALAVVLALVCALGAWPGSAAARTRPPPPVPAGWVGMNLDVVTAQSSTLQSELARMPTVGVEAVRFAFYWSQAQPYATAADVPAAERGRFVDVGGVPTDFSITDRLVAGAARSGLRFLPTVVGVPAWDRQYPGRPFSPPARNEPFGAFLRALIGRYGPRGSFWSEHPELPRIPIRDWQVWNEESSAFYWADDDPGLLPATRRRWVRPYIALLRAAHAAVKSADPGARVVLGGLFSASWVSMRQLYAADRHVGRYFDVAAIHPYTALPSNLLLTLKLNRQVMDPRGDRRKPLLLTEFGWPSAAGHSRPKLGFETTPRGQASLLRTGLNMLAAQRTRLRIAGVYWYAWAGDDQGPSVFSYAGVVHRSLSDGRLSPKPALAVLRATARALERCTRGSRRTGCRTR
jgi:Glycosyl hydrolase family 53